MGKRESLAQILSKLGDKGDQCNKERERGEREREEGVSFILRTPLKNLLKKPLWPSQEKKAHMGM